MPQTQKVAVRMQGVGARSVHGGGVACRGSGSAVKLGGRQDRVGKASTGCVDCREE